jgi:serine protease SohB
MQFIHSILLFASEAAVIVVALLIILFAIALLIARGRLKPELEIEDIGEHFKRFKHVLESEILDKKKLKSKHKAEKKIIKLEKKSESPRKRIFVLDFDGDMKASAVDSLRQEISAILQVATEEDEVVLRLESPGGVVHGYGLAASQLMRLTTRSITLNICVDKIAASGGYMMACVGSKILAAPFAIIGSIGVVASLPNFHKLLQKHDVEYKEVTAGEYKRTVSILGEITEKGMEKFKSQLEETHVLFKNFIAHNRPTLNLNRVATGEYWYGTQALELGLIDHIQTSDDYLMSQPKNAQILKIKFNIKKPLSERFSIGISNAAQLIIEKLIYNNHSSVGKI